MAFHGAIPSENGAGSLEESAKMKRVLLACLLITIPITVKAAEVKSWNYVKIGNNKLIWIPMITHDSLKDCEYMLYQIRSHKFKKKGRYKWEWIGKSVTKTTDAYPSIEIGWLCH